MGVIKRQALKSSVFLYAGVVLGALNMLYIFPKYLETDEIGLYRVLFGASPLFASLSLFGTSQLQVRFYSFFEDKKSKSSFLGLNMLIAVFGLILFLSFFNIFQEPILNYYREKSPLILDYYYLIYPITLGFWVFGFFSAYSRTHKRIVIPNFFKDVYTRIFVACSALVYGLTYFTFDSFLYALVLVYVTSAVWLFVYILTLSKFRLSFNLRPLMSNRERFKKMLGFTTLSTLTGVAGLLIGIIDTLMLGGIQGLNAVGVYTIAFFMGSIIEIPKRSLSQISSPIVAKAWKENDLNSIKKVYKKSSITQFAFGALLLILIWLNIDDIFRIIEKGSILKEGKYVVLFIGLAKLIDMLAGVNGEIIGNSKSYYMNLVFILSLAGLAYATNYFLIPMYGLNGAALASLISYILFNLMKLIFLWFKYRIQPFAWNTLITVGLAFTVFFAAKYIPNVNSPFLNILIKSAMAGLLFVFGVLGLKISTDLNDLWNNFKNKIVHR